MLIKSGTTIFLQKQPSSVGAENLRPTYLQNNFCVELDTFQR